MSISDKILCMGCGQYFDRAGFEQHAGACRVENLERLDQMRETRSKRKTTTLEGPVNINTATLEELQTLPAIGTVMAERIVAARPFESPLDLLKVDGLGHHIWAQLQEHIVI